MMFLSLGLEVFLEDIVGGSFLAPVSDDARGTLDHLPGLALAVNLAQTGPLPQLHVAVHLGAGKTSFSKVIYLDNCLKVDKNDANL